MRIALKGRNVKVTDDLRAHVDKRFGKIGKQVSEFAELEVELSVDPQVAAPASKVCTATLRLKGVTLRSEEASSDLMSSIGTSADELARQVKRHRDKRRARREARSGREAPPADRAAPPGGEQVVEGEILAG